MRRSLTVLLAGFFLWGAPANGKYLDYEDADLTALLSAPPSNESADTQKELAEVRRSIDTATPERMARARSDDRTEEISIFTDALGFEITQSDLPATWQLFREVRHEEGPVVSYAKKMFHRLRPYEVDAKIPHCADAEPGTSYPSGHANYIYATATVMAALVPEKSAAINERADEFAESRLICGMHYRSDIVAGKKLGTNIGHGLLANAEFKKQFDLAVTELRPVLSGERRMLPSSSKLTDKGKALGLK